MTGKTAQNLSLAILWSVTGDELQKTLEQVYGFAK